MEAKITFSATKYTIALQPHPWKCKTAAEARTDSAISWGCSSRLAPRRTTRSGQWRLLLTNTPHFAWKRHLQSNACTSHRESCFVCGVSSLARTLLTVLTVGTSIVGQQKEWLLFQQVMAKGWTFQAADLEPLTLPNAPCCRSAQALTVPSGYRSKSSHQQTK